MATEYKVPLTTIKEILPHTNADALEFAKVYDFNVVVGKGRYKAGDVVVYVPIDSVLSQELTDKMFPPGGKIKLNKNRVKQIKIRGQYSQGLIIDAEYIPNIMAQQLELESNLAETLGITKYEPGPANYQSSSGPIKRNKPKENPLFHKYGGIDNFKWYPELFEEGEQVSITEKIHGSNIRFGIVPYAANNLFRKLLKWLGLAPSHEWVYGSNMVQLQQRRNYAGYYGTDIYGAVLEKNDAKNKVQAGEIWYGEVYGSGIQKNYSYGCQDGERKLVVFDLKYQPGNGEPSYYANVDDFQRIAKERGFEVCPELYQGPFNSEAAKALTAGDSVLVSSQKIREGVVIKPLVETECSIGRKMLKLISEKYLEADNSDFH